MTIKLKIALYNTFLVSIIVGCVLVFMMSISGTVIESNTKNQLLSVVHDNVDELEWKNGNIDTDDIDFYENHVTTLIYSDDGYLLYGYISNIENFNTPLLHGELTSINVNGVDYLLYDYLVSDRKSDSVYIRGIASVAEMSDMVENLFFATLISMPLFIIFTGLGSYFIAKKSLKPLVKIINTAQDISHGDDLSKRLNISGKDEIHQLSTTFDQMFAKLETAFISEKQFSSDVSHELRTPTAVILAECECNLLDSSTPQDKKEALQTIQRQAKKMQQIITALLNLIRLDNGVQKIAKENVDLSELISVVCEEHNIIISEKQQLLTQLPHQLFANVDYSLIIRVVSNLIENGFNYNKQDVDHTSQVTLSLTENQENIIITVTDNGIGIPPEHIDKIFRRFYQVDQSRTDRTTQSMGLGLSMVQQIIHLHNGTITVDSTVNIGTTFIITLPKN